MCLNPQCRTLVPHGGSQCPKCGSVTRPAALCRTCGQDFVKVRLEQGVEQKEIITVGTGDFFSDERTAFLTHQIRELPEVPETQDEEAPPKVKARTSLGNHTSKKLQEVGVCPGCGRLFPTAQERCPSCNYTVVTMLMHQGKMSTCPACGDIHIHGDIVTPLRTGTASTVSMLATHHLDYLKNEDRKLLVFADNRQDAAHQAGYTSDKHRRFALGHAIAHEVQKAGSEGVYLVELPHRLFDRLRELRIIERKPTPHEQKRWLDALTYQAASELTHYSRYRISLENLGIIAVE
ncbi:MAG: hypothetical protein ACUVRD_02155 [Bacteroidia bacterium]